MVKIHLMAVSGGSERRAYGLGSFLFKITVFVEYLCYSR